MITFVYPGGWVRGAKGLLDYLLGPQVLEWAPTSTGRRPYGSRQRANAAAGEVMFIEVADDDVYTVRISSTQAEFIRELVSRAEGKIEAIWSERGTLYSRRPRPVQPEPTTAAF